MKAKAKPIRVEKCHCGREHVSFPHQRRTADCDDGDKVGCPLHDDVCDGCKHLAHP